MSVMKFSRRLPGFLLCKLISADSQLVSGFHLLYYRSTHIVPSLSLVPTMQTRSGLHLSAMCCAAASHRPQHLLILSHLVLPYCDRRETFLMSLSSVPFKLRGRGKYPRWLWFGVMLQSTTERQQLGRGWAHLWACGSADVTTRLGGRKWYGSKSLRGNWLEQLRLPTLEIYHVAFPGTF